MALPASPNLGRGARQGGGRGAVTNWHKRPDDDEPLADRIARVTAEQSRGKALKRLERDGSGADKNVRRRLQVIAQERGLSVSEVSKAIRSNPSLMAFCTAHNLSFDWVFYGDLKGLFRTVQDARITSPEIEQAQAAEVAQLFKRLPAFRRTSLLNGLRNMTGHGRKA
jgi:hypothetical protein